jgi:hypothetical protein
MMVGNSKVLPLIRRGGAATGTPRLAARAPCCLIGVRAVKTGDINIGIVASRH